MKQFYLLTLALLASVSLSAQVFVDADATGAADGSSWADAYTSLTVALDNAADGDQIWIAEGTYVADSMVTISNSLTILGGFAGTEADPLDADPSLYPVVISGDTAGDDDAADPVANRDDNVALFEIDSNLAAISDAIPYSVIFSGLTFTGGQSDECGDCEFVDDFGGGVARAYSPIAVFNSSANGNNGDFGATFMFLPGSDGSLIDGLSADGNYSLESGIVYLIAVANVVVQNSTFTNNNGVRGAITGVSSAFALVDNCLFENNTANVDLDADGNPSSANRGAGVTWSFCNGMLVRDSEFRGNTATFGGAVYMVETDTEEEANAFNHIFLNCEFDQNSSGNFGGNILQLGADAAYLGSTFTENNVGEGIGGAIYNQTLSGRETSTLIDSCEFDNNAARLGGALQLSSKGTTVDIRNSIFTENGGDVSERGGAISTFAASTPDDSPVLVTGSPIITIDSCYFEENEAPAGVGLGGAIYLEGNTMNDPLIIRHSEFVNNSVAGSLGWGGAIMTLFGGDVSVEDSRFIGNSASEGGVIASFNNYNTDPRVQPGQERNFAVVNIRRSVFNANSAASQGGALFSSGVEYNSYNSQYIANQVATDGTNGGVATMNGDSAATLQFEFINNTFLYNYAGAGRGDAISLYQDPLDPAETVTELLLTNNIFYGDGGAVAVSVEEDAVGIITSNGGNFANEEMDWMIATDIVDENANDDIFVFVDDLEDGLVNVGPNPLEEDNPLVDGGVTGDNVPAVDINGTPRDATPDIGSIELSGSVADIIANSSDHTVLEAVLLAAGLTGTLQGDGPFTVFAPTDDAFAAVDPSTLLTIQSDITGLLTPALTYHVVSDFIIERDMLDGVTTSAQTLQGEDLEFSSDTETVTITHAGGTATITQGDLLARNGIVHVIDAVMLPQSVIDVLNNTTDLADSGLEIDIFPNPVVEQLSINATDSRVNDFVVSVIDMNGRRINSYRLNNGRHAIDLSTLPTGMYTLEFVIDNDAYSTRIIKQ